MYQPKHFVQTEPALVRGLMRTHPLAQLVRLGDDGITADPVPLEYDATAGEFGTLRGHVARANPLWRQANGQQVLAIFTGPQAYISPNWYPGKAEHHKVVPTWNYTVVHAHGVLRAIEDAEWLLGLVSRLSARHESTQPQPWSVNDAPPDFVQQMLRAIVGIEIPLTQLVGKWKLSQNRNADDRTGLAAGLAQGGSQDQAVAALVSQPQQEFLP